MCSQLLNHVVTAAAPTSLPIFAITTGSPHAAAAWAAEHTPLLPRAVTLLCDPSRQLHAALQLRRGVARTFTWRLGWSNVRGCLAFPYELCCKGRAPGLNAGDPWQQGGVFLLDAAALPVFEHREESPGGPLLDAAALQAAAARTEVAGARRGAGAGAAERGAQRQRRRAPAS